MTIARDMLTTYLFFFQKNKAVDNNFNYFKKNNWRNKKIVVLYGKFKIIVLLDLDLERKRKEESVRIKKENSTQSWLPFDKILENGIIVRKNSYIKILKVIPINYDLKSNLEKEAILNSYKLFLKTCDFNIQILIQSKKEDLSKHFYNLKQISQQEENKNIREISEKYIEFIRKKSEENKSSSKNFFIIIKHDIEQNSKEENNVSQISINFLNECFFKVKESLSRCGNIIYDVNSKKESEQILMSFFNPKIKENINKL